MTGPPVPTYINGKYSRCAMVITLRPLGLWERPTVQIDPMKRFDARFRIALAFLVTLGILVLCFELGLFLWQDRFSDKSSRLDLTLAPIGLAAGLAVGAVTARWRFQALKELAPKLVGKTLWREKTVLSRSEIGQKALNTEKDSYAALFVGFLVASAVTKAYFVPVGTAAFFVLGVWLAGQTLPYFRLWLWQNSSHAQASSEAPGDEVALAVEAFKERDNEPSNDQRKIRRKKPFDPRLRIALTFVALIPCLTIGWSLWKERSLGTSGLLGLALILMGLAAGLAIGEVIGRWRCRALQEVSARLAGRILFREPNVLSRSDYGQKAIRTEKIVIGIAGLLSVVCGASVKSLFLSIDTLIFFILGLWLTS